MTDPVKLSEAQWEALSEWVAKTALVVAASEIGGYGQQFYHWRDAMYVAQEDARKAFGLDGEEA